MDVRQAQNSRDAVARQGLGTDVIGGCPGTIARYPGTLRERVGANCAPDSLAGATRLDWPRRASNGATYGTVCPASHLSTKS